MSLYRRIGVIAVALFIGVGGLGAINLSPAAYGAEGSQIPSLLELRHATTSAANGAFFWTGRVDGRSMEQTAHDLAARWCTDHSRPASRCETLEDSLAGANLTMPGWDDRDDASVRAWGNASRFFAQQAVGVVRVVMGNQLRPNNVWETIEFPTLQANPHINRVVRVDVANGYAESTIWEQGQAEREPRERPIRIDSDLNQCLDVNNSQLTLWQCNNGVNQQTRAEVTSNTSTWFGSGRWFRLVISDGDGTEWNVQDRGLGRGWPVVLTHNAGATSLWAELGEYGRFVNYASGLCLDAEGGSTTNGTRLITYECGRGALNQTFSQ